MRQRVSGLERSLILSPPPKGKTNAGRRHGASHHRASRHGASRHGASRYERARNGVGKIQSTIRLSGFHLQLPPVIHICFLKSRRRRRPPLPHPSAIATRRYPPRRAAGRWFLSAGLIHICMILPTAAHRGLFLNKAIIPVGIHATPTRGGSRPPAGSRPPPLLLCVFTDAGGRRSHVQPLRRGNIRMM